MHGTCLMCQTYADMQYLGHIKERRGVMRIVQERNIWKRPARHTWIYITAYSGM